MWRIALVAFCVVAVVFLAAMISAIRSMERAWKKGASAARDPFAREFAAAVARAERNEAGGNGNARAGAGDPPAPVGVPAGPAAVAEAVAGEPANVPPPPARELWIDSEYCWVVVCKNHLFHRHPNIFNVHRIPLGQTDAVMPRPPIPETFLVECDECKKKYRYKPSKVLRYEMAPPPSFMPHALFKEHSDSLPDPLPRARGVENR